MSKRARAAGKKFLSRAEVLCDQSEASGASRHTQQDAGCKTSSQPSETSPRADRKLAFPQTHHLFSTYHQMSSVHTHACTLRFAFRCVPEHACVSCLQQCSQVRARLCLFVILKLLHFHSEAANGKFHKRVFKGGRTAKAAPVRLC